MYKQWSKLCLLLILIVNVFHVFCASSESNETLPSTLDKLSHDYTTVFVDLLIRSLEYNRGSYLCHNDLLRLAQDLQKNEANAKKSKITSINS